MKNKKELAKYLDDVIPFDKLIGGITGKVIESNDDAAFELIISYLEKYITKENEEEVDYIVTALLHEDYAKLSVLTGETIAGLIKTPLGDKKEAIIISGLFDILRKLALSENEDAIVASLKKDDNSTGGGPSDPRP